MKWSQSFDPSSIEADLNRSDKISRLQRRQRDAGVDYVPWVCDPSSVLRIKQRELRHRADSNGGPDWLGEINSTPLGRFATFDASLLNREEAVELVAVLQPVYRRMEKQPGYIKGGDLRESLQTLKKFSQGEKLKRSEKYALKRFGYQLACWFHEADDVESSIPRNLVIENVTDVLKKYEMVKSY